MVQCRARDAAITIALFAILPNICLSRKNKQTNVYSSKAPLLVEDGFGGVSTSLLYEEDDMSQVEQVSDTEWRWKHTSKGKLVPSSIAEDILSGLNSSFSISMEIRSTSKKSQLILLRFTTPLNEETVSFVRLEIILDVKHAELIVNYRTLDLESASEKFSIPEPVYRTWVRFVLTVSSTRDESLMWLKASCESEKDVVDLVKRVNTLYPPSTSIVIGGNQHFTSNAFKGSISNAMLHSPALTQYPWQCENAEDRSGHSKRGTDEQITLRRGRNSHSRRDTVISVSEYENLETEVRRCREENQNLMRMVQELQRKMVSVDRRLMVQEECQCINNDEKFCVDKAGVQHQHGERWEPNPCTVCVCDNGFENCRNHSLACYTVSPCASNPCMNEGICLDEDVGFVCRCRPMYYGEFCQYTDQCVLGEVCRNGGVCRRLEGGGYECDCQKGYTGGNCESPLACQSEPCLNGGICKEERDGFSCRCQNGFSGVTCGDEDHCYSNPCQNGGACYETRTGYRCRCRGVYSGVNCEEIDHCMSAPCQNDGTCHPTGDGYRCQCSSGYGGKDCESEDACYSSPCENGGRCVVTSESYRCLCRSGYYGVNCEDASACMSSPCINGGRCITTDDVGSYSCSCPATHTGTNCEYINECHLNPCLNSGTCVPQANGKAQCNCRLTNYGDLCQHMDYCRGNPCLNSALCRNQPGNTEKPFTCDCHSGYIGEFCQFQDLCVGEPCLNGGRCTMDGRFRVCDCPPSYIGELCEKVDFCANRPCLNRGTCFNEENGFRCECPDTHTGVRCEYNHPCRPNPCSNNGICTATGQTGYICECPPSHYGPDCQYENFCRTNPCKNGGLCTSTKDGFVCKCSDGFHGTRCELQELCSTNPCRNGGTCVEEEDTFRCICPETHQGSYCEYSCNVCMFSHMEGRCKADERGEEGYRWYYNKDTQSCQMFHYSGCGGNGNNFETRQDCKRRCIVGACCSLSHNTLQVSCRGTSMGQCKRINNNQEGIQVMSFVPGERCNRGSCKAMLNCKVGLQEYDVNERSSVGCQRSCICRNQGRMECQCTKKELRREIRRISTPERNSFIKAIAVLKLSESYNGRNAWDAMRDEYMRRAAIAQNSDYFLLWNRAFLWKMEFLLKKVDCSVSIPFYDFTMDAGKFDQSVVWQPNYFGGNGNKEGCVMDHVFQDFNDYQKAWKPCISRSFNVSVGIPNMIDVGKVLKAKTYKELSSKLQQIASSVHAFVGGDMASTSRAYDPLFYSVHAFIDHIFMVWQDMHSDQDELEHIQSLDLIPFGLSVQELWDGACVEYGPYDFPNPCNHTSPSPELFGSEGFNLQGYNRQGFNRDGYDKFGYDILGRNIHGQEDTSGRYADDGYNEMGYNRSGYDRRGYDRFGYDSEGINREGFDMKGYDKQGYNRYGLNRHGFDRRGYNIYGMGKNFKPDLSDFYDKETGFNDCCFGRDGLTPSGLDRFGFTVEGFDANRCDYFFNGPHSPYYKHKLWSILHVQPLSFLSSVPRSCNPLSQLSNDFYSMNWIQDTMAPRMPAIHDFSSYLSSNVEALNHAFTERFCFDVDMYLTWCPCLEENYPAICSSNPCDSARCQLHKGARCVVNMCGDSCKAEFILDGRRVNCENPCSVNPCQNGGICEPSRFSSESESFKCLCPAEYIGSLCEQPVADACMLEKAPGNCGGRFRRWYYNFVSMKCEEFIFTGCSGNPNNFASKKACDLRCSAGACCYRFPINQTFEVGFDREGFDKYGFNKHGVNRLGQQRSAYDSMPSGNRINPPKGFGPDGFDIYGYNEKGIDRQGYDRSGYHQISGFNKTGYNVNGEYDELKEYNTDGFDVNGYNRAGYSCSGIDREGFNQLGLYYDFSYTCQTMFLSECEALKDPGQLEVPFEVVSFSPGKSCEEVNCGEKCGCEYKDKKYHFGEVFHSGCEQCTCTLGGVVTCECQRLGKRKEIRDLSADEFSVYVAAIQKLHMSKKWESYAQLHAQHMPQANGAPISLPWHRNFLRLIEEDIQMAGGCDVFIPYFDWTIDAGDLANSQIWQANYFGSTGCVKHHPFSGEGLWHPCIRRMFNTSISLPDAVIVQFIIREPSYEKFRLQLETISGLFHLWVGGHMASPFSPYDPIYLSHWAFMDYIWTEWQARNPNGVSRFPPEFRYVKMKPFDVSPDDVLTTQHQICVVYIPPTMGTSCNVTALMMMDHGSGVNRHGIDDSGYDMDGFDKYGMDRGGRKDVRGKFNRAGFNDQGYNRLGFDASGWDIYGYNTDNFNRDGVDIEGYDRSGYDRYGFDRNGKTPFGMYMNGAFAPGADKGYAASLFDKFGFNKYGFDKHGLNHKGFDTFGFDRDGFDEDNCNYYNMGPHYLRTFFFTITHLQTLKPDALKVISRICEPITALPDYWISQSWMSKLPLIREIESEWQDNHKFDETWKPRTSSVTDERLWLPVSPEGQFCFKLDETDSCPLGTAVVECIEDLCAHSACASHRNAQCRNKNCGSCYPEFYDGTTGEILECYGCVDESEMVRTEGSMWQKQCETCSCHSGMITCMPTLCPKLMCSHPAKSDGECCESCQDCEFEDRLYRDRQRFQPSECKMCECQKGSVTCTDIVTDCPDVTCDHPVTLPGECCESCPTDCMGHREGDVWEMDKCTSCSCRSGMMMCSAKPCPHVSCEYPITAAGECCQECTGCNYEGRKYANDQNFMKDVCTQCTCRFGNVMCVTQNCPRLNCEHQETPHGSCCPRCREGCNYGGVFYDEGTSFQPTTNNCLNCTCQDGDVQCARLTCPAVACARPVVRTGQCCAECLGCQEGPLTYSQGQMWTSRDGCQKCLCDQGTVQCNDIVRCRETCTHGIQSSTQRCCKDCSRCSYEGQTYRHADVFISKVDICKRCVCQFGNVVCTDMVCPNLQCEITERVENQCCPQCRSCIYNSVRHEHGSTWGLEEDPCVKCDCDQGDVNCVSEVCDPPRCTHPALLNNLCCRTCDGCQFQGVNYRDGETVDRGACYTCRCQAGSVRCSPVDCPDVACDSPVTPEGECCPRCQSCSYKGEQFEEGETFLSPRNPCLQCKCQSGAVQCDRLDLDCPRLTCSNPGRKRGICCPMCSVCEYQRRTYENGQTFTPPGSSNCLQCTCQDGDVECRTEECPSVSCHRPINKPGQCCPVCEECIDDGRTYSNGATWNRGSCTVCECHDGVTECSAPNCPTTTCSHPAQAADECCPTCNSCLFHGTMYSNQATFKATDDSCIECRCNSGTVTCSSVQCKRLLCPRSHILDGECCPSCINECEVDGLDIRDGETIAHPTRRCTICSCRGGFLDCRRDECNARVPCRHPSMGECCKDQCTNCMYQSRDIQNGQTFSHPRDKCNICTCTNGDVSCLRARCPKLDCANPTTPDGECCPKCPDVADLTCEHNGVEHKHGDRFRVSCDMCECFEGEISCSTIPCPRANCKYPVQTGCCPVCDGCTIGGTTYQERDSVPNMSGNLCQTCECIRGNIECSDTRCPRVTCPYPVRGECCDNCDGCTYNGQQYDNDEVFASPDASCDDCTCNNGRVTCAQRICRAVSCTHPVKREGDCCPSCDQGCLFENRIYTENDGMFSPVGDTNGCQLCVCNSGSIVCKQKPCAKVSCRNPVTDLCNCPMCTDCSYNGILRRNKETFANPEDAQCSECTCSNGNVACGRQRCASPACTHPVKDECDCPTCEQCLYAGRVYNTGEKFMDEQDTCNECICQDGNALCTSKACPVVTCNNPVGDECGCDRCVGCNYLGTEYDEGDRFDDAVNRCNTCTCQGGTVRCQMIDCPQPSCSNPSTVIGECCPVCLDTCTQNGKVYNNGETFVLPSDPCSTCTCASGDIRCTFNKCVAQCTHPIARNRCCPDCSACLYQGFKYSEGQIFLSRINPCQQCSCSRGNVVCNEMRCPVPECSNPKPVRGKCCPKCPQPQTSGDCSANGRTLEVGAHWVQDTLSGQCQECECLEGGTVSCADMSQCEERCTHSVPQLDKCCPSCQDCFYENQTYSNGEMFKPDQCRNCACNQGNVRCITKECPPLPCPENEQITPLNDCCKQCVSCVIGDRTAVDGDKWKDPINPCIECQCFHGIVTCAPTRCKQVCASPVIVPGECCPVCPGCTFDNKIYSIGDEFQPNPVNPCEICQCVANPATGQPTLKCYRQQCPSLADCPRLCLQQPRAGTCCPTCTNRADCRYGLCNTATTGRELQGSDDRCFHCMCTDTNTWICTRENCRELNCPPAMQYTPQGGCCPICDNCYIPEENRSVPSGTVWRPTNCNTCQCNNGAIICNKEQCPVSINCRSGTQLYREEGQCCERCVDLNLPCQANGKTYMAQQEWKVDQCTTCKCLAGKINCMTEKCRPLSCEGDKIPSVLPGQCCPRCEGKPSSCIAFGDPHFRTFDGRMIHFQGVCEYLMAADCLAGDFKVMVKNSNDALPTADRHGQVSWVDKITIITEGGTITIQQDHSVLVNGTKITRFPFFFTPYFHIEVAGNHVLLNTNLGVQINWNGVQRHLEVSVPPIYQRRICGLCGNFNNFPQDDLRMRNSRMTTSDSTFGNNWKVTGPNIATCPDAVDVNPCDGVTYAIRKASNDHCKVIKSDLFSACHGAVNPDMFYAACVYDACVCRENSKMCICDVLDAYSTQCRRAGVVINWRSATLCPISCFGQRGYIYNECGSPCSRTCATRGAIEEECHLPCVSGCQCPPGKVEHNNACITPDLCPNAESSIQPANPNSQISRAALRGSPRITSRHHPLMGRPMIQPGTRRFRRPLGRRFPQLQGAPRPFVPNLRPAPPPQYQINH